MFWQHQVLRGVGGQGSRKYSAVEGYGNQYWPTHSSIVAWRTPLPEREAWQATVYRVAKSQTLLSDPAHIDTRLFFACGSTALVRVERESGTAAWLEGTLPAPSVQGQRLPLPQELWSYQSLFLNLLQLVIRRPFWPVFLHSSTHSGTQRAPLPGILFCCSAQRAHRGPSLAGVLLCRSECQSLKRTPWVGSCSVVQCVRHLTGQTLYSTVDAVVWGQRGYGNGSTLYA